MAFYPGFIKGPGLLNRRGFGQGMAFEPPLLSARKNTWTPVIYKCVVCMLFAGVSSVLVAGTASARLTTTPITMRWPPMRKVCPSDGSEMKSESWLIVGCFFL